MSELAVAAEPQTPSRHFSLIQSLDSLQSLADKLQADGTKVGFDVETGYHGPDRPKGALDIDWDEQFVCGFSLTNSPTWARYVPLGHDPNPALNLPENEAWEIMKPVLEGLPIVAHNMKFELRNLRALARKKRGPRIDINVCDDSMLQSYVLSENMRHGLKELTWERFGYKQKEIKTLFPGVSDKALKALRFNVLELTQEVIDYACDDAVWTLALSHDMLPTVERERRFMYELEMREMIVLADMEDAGHATDWEGIAVARTEGEPFLAQMVTAARNGLGEMARADLSSLNLNSAPQMRKVLYEDLGLQVTRMTKGGKKSEPAPSTDKIALEALSRQHAPIKKILESREVKNLTNRMKKWLTEYHFAHDDRVHASFNQVAVGSGRFSANDPAIQQLPKKWRWTTILNPEFKSKNDEHMAALRERGEHGKHYWEGNFRNFLVAGPGCYLLGFDYSQIELRCMAGMSQEPGLLKAFAEDRDVHTLTAAMMLGKKPEDITEDERGIGKTQNFAILYGMGVKSLAERLALSLDEAQRLYDEYFRQFPSVTRWMNQMKSFGMGRGYIETHYGRKWTLWDLKSDSWAQQGKGERLCVNGPVQGTAADYMKISMLRAREVLIEKGWWMTKVRMINNLHDALTFEADNSIDPNELREVLKGAVVHRSGIENFPKIVADWELGQKWGSSTRWKDEACLWNGEFWEIVKDFVSGETEEKDEDLTEEDFGEAPLITYDEDGFVVEAVREESSIPNHPLMVVQVTEMPEQDGFARFMDLVRGNPGYTVIRLETPEGTVDLEQVRTGLTPEHQGRISLLLGGAKVFYPMEVDMDQMSAAL